MKMEMETVGTVKGCHGKRKRDRNGNKNGDE
jgi:hypothetical protein